jgi:hypothetical protein
LAADVAQEDTPPHAPTWLLERTDRETHDRSRGASTQLMTDNGRGPRVDVEAFDAADEVDAELLDLLLADLARR